MVMIFRIINTDIDKDITKFLRDSDIKIRSLNQKEANYYSMFHQSNDFIYFTNSSLI